MAIQTYNEFKVIYDNKGKIIDSEKRLTARKTVRINERTAAVNNSYSESTGLYYELVEEVKKPGRKPATN